jgi:predicted metal-dependent HD superfamily phosphohydrolase
VAAGGLIQRWCDLFDRWGAPPGAVRAQGQSLLARYREPHRRYHTTTHLAEVLSALDRRGMVTARPAGVAPAAVEVEAAAWLHDAVYDPRAAAGTNEADSGRYAEEVLGGLGAEASTCREVFRLIGLTATHTADPGDAAGAALVDADLWILGAPASRYRRYATEVRQEYGWLDAVTWRVGRSAVLDRFLARPRLFVDADFHAELDDRARDNMAWELATLRAGEPEA